MLVGEEGSGGMVGVWRVIVALQRSGKRGVGN
jgi:hypothetical protein